GVRLLDGIKSRGCRDAPSSQCFALPRSRFAPRLISLQPCRAVRLRTPKACLETSPECASDSEPLRVCDASRNCTLLRVQGAKPRLGLTFNRSFTATLDSSAFAKEGTVAGDKPLQFKLRHYFVPLYS